MGKILLIGLCIFALLHLHDADAESGSRLGKDVSSARLGKDVGDDDGDMEYYNVGEVESNDLREARRIGSGSSDSDISNWGDWDFPDKTDVPGYKEEKFHQKVVPWFKRQWGHTKNFFEKNYEKAKNSIG